MLEGLEELLEQAARGEFTPKGRGGYRNVIDLTGRTYGLLTVVQRLPNDNSATRWLCSCACGEQVMVAGGNLRSGNSKSCGCINHRTGARSVAWKGCGELTGAQWSRIKANAVKRNHEVRMTIQEAWDLYEKQQGLCALTGWILSLSNPLTASLDRIDSSGAYEIANVQWVHKDVNKAKNVFSQDYFIEMCTAVSVRKS